MSAVWLRLRSEVRRRWRAWIGLAVLVGFAGGAAMALAQAARRSQHAYVRFSDRESAADVVMTGANAFGLVGSVDLAAVARTGYIAQSAPAFVGLPFSGHTGSGRPLNAVDLFPVAAGDNQLGTTVERWKMLDGRRARPSQIGEATASFVLAERLGLQVGSTLELRFYRADTFATVAPKLIASLAPRIKDRDAALQSTPDFADGPRVKFTIVGIEASPLEFPPLLTDLAPVLHLTPAFAHRYEKTIVGSPLSYFRLKPGRDLKSFELAVERMAAGNPVSFISTRETQSAKVQRSIRAEAAALAIVAGLVALTGAVAIAQALTRQTLAESSQLPMLRALGMRDRQLRAFTLARVVVIGGAGAVIAALVAVFGSQYLLLPLARKAELDPGPHFDVVVVLVGGVTVFLVALAAAMWSGYVAARRERPRNAQPMYAATQPKSRFADGGRLGTLPLTTTLGVRFAIQRATRAIPAWATIATTALTVAMLTGALTFTSNLHRVLDDPHRYGWNWDVKIGAPGLPDYSGFVVPTLRDDPDVAALSVGTVTQIDAGRARIDVLAVNRIKGDALPTMLAGRAPTRPGEIALGGRSMSVLHVGIGGTIDARIGTRSERLRVVGQTVLPEFGDAGQLGTGSLMTLSGLDRLLPKPPANVLLVQFGRVPDRAAAGARLARAVEPIPAHFQARPEDLIELSRGGGLLVALLVLLGILGFTVLLHALITSVRARERDFGVLRALGFVPRQMRSTVAWQVVTLTVGSLVIGLPLGSLLGRFVWLAFARQLGVASDAIFLPPYAFAIVAAAALALALVAAVVPAAIVARTRTSRVLHSE